MIRPRTTLLPRGVYLLPLLDPTGKPVIVLVDRRQRLIHQVVAEPDESEETALARAAEILELLDPTRQD